MLGSAIAMLAAWGIWPWEQPWLTAKITALLLYIGLGMVALRFGRSRRVRICAWLAALATAGYIVAVAFSRDPMGYLVLL